MVVDEYGILASCSVTSGTVADCSQAFLLINGLETDIATVIPPVKSRKERTTMNCIGHGTSSKTSSEPSSTDGELLRAAQSSPLPLSPPFMSGVCSSAFQSILPR
ncbi:hypothetical protein [Treponema endosymbiont of Eucomonympha sp.]|uniref:hypothetical protein n=1 Tax=Treponema endosymbiont of Eucomonympha sp. TaxID=1580831 RepID=UPI001EE7556B|nr:hypothetical protein [Treponema endosymbiont of Eucomonympha sp.]